MRRALLGLVAAVGLAAQDWPAPVVERVMGDRDFVLLLDRGTGFSQWSRGLDPAFTAPPCSTFKLPHALVALEVGVIQAGTALTCRPAECHAAHGTLKVAEAIRVSCVSFFRQTARRLGAAQMAQGLARLGYPGAGSLRPLDGFWLDGAFRIGPDQQLAWIRRFYTEPLGVAPAHLYLVRGASRLERAGGWEVAGKAGSSRQGLGWFAGQITRGGEVAWVVVLLRGAGATGREAERRLRGLLEGEVRP